MGNLNEPVEILVEALRAMYKEPARSGYSKRHTNVSESFNGDNAEVNFTVSNTKLLCINSVTVDGNAQTKYADYDIDIRNNKIVFGTAPGVGVNNVVIDYDYNASAISWIFEKDPEREAKLKLSDYPRISVTQLSSVGNYLGIGGGTTQEIVDYQIDVVTKDGIVTTNYIRIDSDGSSNTVTENNANRRLVQVIKRGIRNSLKRNLVGEVGVVFFPAGAVIKEDTPIGFEEDRGIFRTVLVVSLNGINLGEFD